MEKRIQEARKCLDNGLYEAALALALTLPDIVVKLNILR